MLGGKEFARSAETVKEHESCDWKLLHSLWRGWTKQGSSVWVATIAMKQRAPPGHVMVAEDTSLGSITHTAEMRSNLQSDGLTRDAYKQPREEDKRKTEHRTTQKTFF